MKKKNHQSHRNNAVLPGYHTVQYSTVPVGSNITIIDQYTSVPKIANIFKKS